MIYVILAQAASGPGLWPTIEHGALVIAIVGGVVGIMVSRRKREVRRIEPQPFEVTGEVRTKSRMPAVRTDTCNAMMGEVTRRLTDNETQIDRLWFTMREEDEKTREALNKSFHDIERSLGRIEGKLDRD